MITAADLAWIATASLTREFPDRAGFTPDEIQRRTEELESDVGVRNTYIGRPRGALRAPAPEKYRQLHANADGTYRLYWSGDPSHAEQKNERILPNASRIPAKYRDLLDWYRSQNTAPPQESRETDPILALAGIGKDVWRDLGGGEKFIRELRASGRRGPTRHVAKSKPAKRKRVP